MEFFDEFRGGLSGGTYGSMFNMMDNPPYVRKYDLHPLKR